MTRARRVASTVGRRLEIAFSLGVFAFAAYVIASTLWTWLP